MLIAVIALGLVKLSISLLYYHIFETSIFRRVIIGWIAILVIWTVTFTVLGLAECGPHLAALFGSPQVFIDKCSSALHIGMAMNVSDIATDFITLILPIPMVSSLLDACEPFLTQFCQILRLKMPLAKRASLVCLFMIGSL